MDRKRSRQDDDEVTSSGKRVKVNCTNNNYYGCNSNAQESRPIRGNRAKDVKQEREKQKLLRHRQRQIDPESVQLFLHDEIIARPMATDSDKITSTEKQSLKRQYCWANVDIQDLIIAFDSKFFSHSQ